MFKIRVKFLILLVLFFAIAYSEGGPLFYRVFYGFAAVLILSLLMVFFNKRYLDIDILFERSIYSAGDNGKFTMVLNNRGLLPIPYLVVMNSALKKLSSRYNGDAVYVGGISSKKLRYEVRFKQRGIYNFGDTDVRFRDAASIMESKGTYYSKTSIQVYPRIISIDPGLFRGFNFFNNYRISQSGKEDLYTVKDNRKYREGDSLKRINWKVSARYSELYVRNHEVVVGEEFNVFLDMNVSNYQYDSSGIGEEQLIDTCASVVHYLTKRKVVSKLYINSSRQAIFSIEERKDFEHLMDYFMMNKSDSNMPFINFLKINMTKDSAMTNIALITSRVDKGLLEYVMDLEQRKKNIFIFYNQLESEDGLNIIKLRKLGVQVIDVSQIIR